MTPKETRFVEEYLLDLNATKAAIRAGYSQKTARAIGCENLTKPHIQEAIAAAMQARSERTQISADWLLKRLVAEAEADVADLYDEYNNLKPIHQWPKIWRTGLVAGLDVEEFTDKDDVEHVTRKLKLSDRTKRLELIGRHINVGAFKDKTELDATPPLLRLLQEIGGRAIRPADETQATRKKRAPATTAITPTEQRR